MVGSDPAFVLTVDRVSQEVKASVGVLDFGEVIGLPLGFLQHVADAVPAFGNAEVIELGHARE